MYRLPTCMGHYSGTSLKGLPKFRKPLNQEQKLWSQQAHLNTLLPLKKENLCISSKKIVVIKCLSQTVPLFSCPDHFILCIG